MAIGEINTKVSLGPTNGRKVGNLILEDARFFGRPNFSGIEDQFKDTRRKFTVLIPNDVADTLREVGYNVKTSIPTEEQRSEGREDLSHLKVMVDDISRVDIKAGENINSLEVPHYGVVDQTRFTNIDMEIRAWEFNPAEKPGEYSARLVRFVGEINMSALDEKYGI
jgi:hypothetical protein